MPKREHRERNAQLRKQQLLPQQPLQIIFKLKLIDISHAYVAMATLLGAGAPPLPPAFAYSSRVVAHIDLDCFYCQVEQRRLDIPREQPCAVQQWQGLIAGAAYPARAWHQHAPPPPWLPC